MAKVLSGLVVGASLVLSAFLPITSDAAPARGAQPEIQNVVLPAHPNTVRNPIRENAADPWMVFAEGNYHLLYTHGDKLVGVSAPSVAGLGAAPQQTLWQPPPGEACCNLWAPEIHQLDGKWYLYYTADN